MLNPTKIMSWLGTKDPNQVLYTIGSNTTLVQTYIQDLSNQQVYDLMQRAKTVHLSNPVWLGRFSGMAVERVGLGNNLIVRDAKNLLHLALLACGYELTTDDFGQPEYIHINTPDTKARLRLVSDPVEGLAVYDSAGARVGGIKAITVVAKKGTLGCEILLTLDNSHLDLDLLFDMRDGTNLSNRLKLSDLEELEDENA